MTLVSESLRRALFRRSLLVALALPVAAAIGGAGCSESVSNSNDAVATDVVVDDAAPKDPTSGTAAEFRKDGPFAVGVQTYTISQPSGRTISVEAVYPMPASDTAGAPLGMASFCTNTADSKTYQDLLDKAPKDCPTLAADVVRDGSPASGAFPVVLFSHCHECTRFSSLALVRRLASHGMVVLAPDHVGNTLFDKLAGQGVALGKPFLTVRVADLKSVLDDAELDQKAALPASVRAIVDMDKVGAMGHSFGSVTAGLFAQQDDRVKAVAGVAAPMQNPLLPGVEMKSLDKPLLLVLAVEDNSITVAGNIFLENNFKDAPGPAWKLSVDDAGHWSFSDIAGLIQGFEPGCGDGERMTDGAPFSYLPVAEAQAIVANWLSAFFAAHLRDAAGAKALLAAEPLDKRAKIERK